MGKRNLVFLAVGLILTAFFVIVNVLASINYVDACREDQQRIRENNRELVIQADTFKKIIKNQKLEIKKLQFEIKYYKNLANEK